jgi:hypothetical protein
MPSVVRSSRDHSSSFRYYDVIISTLAVGKDLNIRTRNTFQAHTMIKSILFHSIALCTLFSILCMRVLPVLNAMGRNNHYRIIYSYRVNNGTHVKRFEPDEERMFFGYDE